MQYLETPAILRNASALVMSSNRQIALMQYLSNANNKILFHSSYAQSRHKFKRRVRES